MNKEIAEAAMKFMMRVQLTGQEVPAFNAVMQELDDLSRGEDKPAAASIGDKQG